MRGVHQRCGPSALPEVWAGGPHAPHGWAYPAHTRGSFRFTTKGTKGVPGLPPLDPAGGHYHPPPAALPLPPERLSATTKDRFATLDLWANRSCFSSGFIEGTLSIFNSWLGRWGCLRGYRKFYTLATNTARAQGRGIKGGYAPLRRGGQGPGGPWRIFAYFLYARK